MLQVESCDAIIQKHHGLQYLHDVYMFFSSLDLMAFETNNPIKIGIKGREGGREGEKDVHVCVDK